MKLKDGKSYNQFAHSKDGIDYRAALEASTIAGLTRMISFDGLPDTMPSYVVMRNAICGGWQWITKLKGNLISFTGGPGGAALGPGYDYNYLPTHIVIANPYLDADGGIPSYSGATQTSSGFSKTLPLSDGVLVKTNSELMPLTPLVEYFSKLEDTAATTLRMSLIMSRMAMNWLAKSDPDHEAMLAYVEQIEQGDLAVALTKEWQDKPELLVGANAGSATLLKSQIEALQYIRGYKWQTFGVQSNHNMKREAINESEAGMNENSLLPFVDDIVSCLTEGFDEVNRRYGTNITVRYNSAWREIQQEVSSDEPVAADGNESPADDPADPDTPLDGAGGAVSGSNVDRDVRHEAGDA